MNILALDTSFGACSAAVVRDGEIFSAYELRSREHAEAIMPMIAQVLDEASLGYEALGAIAVTTGPGSFTGVRVGVSTARGLALAAGLPLIGLNSLEVMAQMALEKIDAAIDVLGIVVDARRGEVYLALYNSKGDVISGPAALSPDQAVEILPDHGQVVLAGSGGALVVDATAKTGLSIDCVLSELQPDAASLAAMAVTRAPVEGPLSPLYLRPPDAKPQTGKALPRQS
jgi:tRNA threonylcarbamoyladenosine biosynthesis protein TsaB